MNRIFGKVLYKGRIVEAGIEFEETILKVGKNVKGNKVKGLILPAAIDVHVHFRDFNESHKETIETGSLSAIHGGVCLVVDQPNCKPVVDSLEIYEKRMRKAEKKIYCDYSLNLALTNSNCGKIAEILEKLRKKYTVPAVGEVFLEHTNPDLQISYETLRNVLETNKIRLTIHAEDPKLVEAGTPNFKYRPEEAEVSAVNSCLMLSRTELLHFCHISTTTALELLKNSSSTCEVTPHHLLLSIKDYSRLKEFINVNPPLRERPLLEHLNDFDVIASDHAPHTPEEKKDGLPGFPGVETMYPIIVSLIKDGIIGIGAVERLTSIPAKIFGFDRLRYGEIEVGKFANFAVFDFSKETRINSRNLHSMCGWTPYEGFKAIFPNEVWLRGERVIPEEARLGRVL